MMYADNSKKFVAVLNASVAVPALLNALGHVTAGLAAGLQGEAEFLDYNNDQDGFVSQISLSPFIVLKAKNSSQLATLRAAAAAASVRHNTFVSPMIGRSAQEQLEQTKVASGDTLQYWAVLLFGDAEQLKPLTKKFSLFSLSQAAVGHPSSATHVDFGKPASAGVEAESSIA